jgi:LysR family nitrogen assimilation transcriptional regulator
MIDRYAKDTATRLNVILEMDALSQIKALISRGSGYTILAPAAAQDFVDTGNLVSSPIIDPILHRPAYLVRNSAKPQTRAIKEVEALVLKVVADLVRRGLWTADLAPNLIEI